MSPHRARSLTFLSPLWYRQTAGPRWEGAGAIPCPEPRRGMRCGNPAVGWGWASLAGTGSRGARRPHHLPSPVAPITCSSPPGRDQDLLPARVRNASDPPPVHLPGFGAAWAGISRPFRAFLVRFRPEPIFPPVSRRPRGVAPGAKFAGSRRMLKGSESEPTSS